MGRGNTRLLVGLGVLGITFLALTTLQTWTWTKDQIKDTSDQQTKLLNDTQYALRAYFTKHVRPEMAKRVGKDDFIPASMSSSYFARKVMESVRDKNPDYVIRFPSTNPRNPANEPSAAEKRIIRYFQKNPTKSSWTGTLNIKGKPYYARAVPRHTDASCMSCHGSPKDAPAALVKQYGDTAGFHRKIGEISMDLVALPKQSIYAAAFNKAKHRLATVAIACLLFLAGIAVLISRDRSERGRWEQTISEYSQRHKAIWEAATEGLCMHEMVYDDKGKPVDYRIVEANPAFEVHCGLRANLVCGRLASEVYGVNPPPFLDIYAGVADTGVPAHFEAYCAPLGKDFSVAAFSPGRGQFATAFFDISDRKTRESELRYQSAHDTLTGLANRQCFEQFVVRLTDSPRARKQGDLAILFLDLDKFKLINDTLGHQVGDSLLVEVGARLQSCLRPGDALARLGGDEFAVCISRCHRRQTAVAVATRIIDSISRPFEIDGHRFVIGASVGLAGFPSDGDDAVTLLRHADAAMYKAKQAGRGTYRWYTGDVDKDNISRIEIEMDVRTALEKGQFEVYYQPITSMQTGQIAGAEALLRWEHPEKGMISPSLFIPIAEEIGLIGAIGEYVLRTACFQCKSWQDMGLDLPKIGVNVSTMQLRNPGWKHSVKQALKDSGLEPRSLNMEITETELAADYPTFMTVLRSAEKMGVQFAIDDFGMGHSSLSRLKDFPVIHLKVDGSFVRNIEHSDSDRALLGSIVEMAHGQGIKVTAEWVETEAQSEILRSCGCDYAQGYFISPPLSAERFEEFLRGRSEAGRRAA